MTRSEAHPTPIELLWKAPAIAALVVAGEALALVLALAPGVASDRWVYFGLASLMIQWIVLLALSGTFLFRGVLLRLRPAAQAWLALVLLLAATWTTGGLAAWLLGLRHEEQVHRDPLWGALFENMVIIEALKDRLNAGESAELFFYRDSEGNEVDLMLPMGRQFHAIEIKAGATVITGPR